MECGRDRLHCAVRFPSFPTGHGCELCEKGEDNTAFKLVGGVEPLDIGGQLTCGLRAGEEC